MARLVGAVKARRGMAWQGAERSVLLGLSLARILHCPVRR